VSRFIGLLFISSGAAACIGGAAAFWSLQASTTEGTLWPLPALALLEWGILGFAGFLLARPGDAAPGWPGRGLWAIGGALLPLGVIGALSIGPFVMLSAVLLLLGAALSSLTRSKITGQDLRWLAGGLVGHLLLLLTFVALA